MYRDKAEARDDRCVQAREGENAMASVRTSGYISVVSKVQRSLREFPSKMISTRSHVPTDQAARDRPDSCA